MSGDGGPLSPRHDEPALSEAETAELAGRINDNPNLQPISLEETIHRARYLHSEPGPMDASDRTYAQRIAIAVRKWLIDQPVVPLPMVLHCPSCHAQHIDQATAEWDNPPHRSHLCGSCGCVWRPADVPTVGVYLEGIKTRGVSDNWPPADAPITMQDEGDLPPLCGV